MRSVSILGSTGSIGQQALQIIRLHPNLFRVSALAAGANIDLLEQQVREFAPSSVSCAGPKAAGELRQRLRDYDRPLWIGHSAEGLERVASAVDVEIVVSALPGSTGLTPTFAAVNAGKDLALATKEVLVMAGDLFMQTVAKKKVNLLPVDSEQSAIFQCLQANDRASVRRIILTASGGPFRDLPADDMARVTRDQALNHPRWTMGPKVTVDSATLMNKGLEVIEARWLFGVPVSRIEVVIHPQSIVHSMVEFLDGSIIAQLGATDMRIPISYALGFPRRIESGTAAVSFPELGSLTFAAPDFRKFPLLKAAHGVLEQGGSAPIVLNAADEVAVELFLDNRIPFSHISRIVLESLNAIPSFKADSLAEIMEGHEHVVERVRADWNSLAG